MNILPTSTIPADPILTGRVVSRFKPTSVTPLAVFQAVYQGGTNGIQVDIVVGGLLNALTIQLLRGFSLDPAQAKVVQTWSGPFGAQSSLEYTDAASAVLAATKVYYWASIVYEQTPNLNQQQFGPQIAYVNATMGGSEQIPAFGVSITPNAGVLDVAIAFELPPSSDFGSAQVFVTGYNKIAARQLVAEGASSPFSFAMEPTGETVTFQINAVTGSGQPVSSGPTQQVELASNATVPAPIYNGTAITNTVGNQITFPGPPESDVTELKVYRQNLGGAFSGSTLIATLSPSPEKSYTVTDQIANPQDYIYYVTATNNIGESSPSPAIIPGKANSNASQGTGATAVIYMVTTTVPGLGNGLTFVAAAPITGQGNNYYAQPQVTFSPSSASGGRSAKGTAVLDGAGHVTFIQITDGGVYSSGDIDTATCTIHY